MTDDTKTELKFQLHDSDDQNILIQACTSVATTYEVYIYPEAGSISYISPAVEQTSHLVMTKCRWSMQGHAYFRDAMRCLKCLACKSCKADGDHSLTGCTIWGVGLSG